LAALAALAAAEEAFFAGGSSGGADSTADSGGGNAPWAWNGETLKTALEGAGFAVTLTVLDREEERLITEGDLERWFNRASAWGAAMENALGREALAALRSRLSEIIRRRPVTWRWKSLLVKGTLL
jgi:hypothetical protein